METEKNVQGTVGVTEAKNLLTHKDVIKSYNSWHAWAEVGHSFERMQGMGFCRAFLHPLQKLYKGNDEGMKRALQRSAELFNTEGLIGASVVGAALSMEETMMGQSEDEKDAAITGVKIGLMGPFAGIGDALNWTVLKPIVLGIGCDMALKGSWIGALIAAAFAVLMYFEGRYMFTTGYKLGKNAFSTILGSGLLDKLTLLAGALGIFMMGALGASYVFVSTPVEIVISNQDPIILQDALDSIVPGILPLAAMFGIYKLMKKTKKISLICVAIILLSLVLSLLGIL